MYVLDTNILSELIRQLPNIQVINWVDTQDADELATTSISVAEMLFGVERLTGGKRKIALKELILTIFVEDFEGRIMPFDDTAAAYYANLVAKRERMGRPISMADAQIAAICQAHNAVLVTRNTKDFAAIKLPLINPWE